MINENVTSNIETSRDLFRRWAVMYARESGYEVDDNATVELSTEMETTGCCDWCYTTEAVTTLTVGGYSMNLNYYFN